MSPSFQVLLSEAHMDQFPCKPLPNPNTSEGDENEESGALQSKDNGRRVTERDKDLSALVPDDLNPLHLTE